MDREYFYQMIQGEGKFDYELYLNTPRLLTCQKEFKDFCNPDELQFQVVHQSEELWMKLLAYTLLDIDDYLQAANTNRVLTLFARVYKIQRLMTDQLALLETMSPKEYQEIRLQLGNGSGQESPGFRTLRKMYKPLWDSYKATYLDARGLTIEKIYDSEYKHDDAYVIAEALFEFDLQFHNFLYHHIKLIHRSIGLHAKSLKGRSVDILNQGLQTQFFPELWAIRSEMTDRWGAQYGVKRESLSHAQPN